MDGFWIALLRFRPALSYTHISVHTCLWHEPDDAAEEAGIRSFRPLRIETTQLDPERSHSKVIGAHVSGLSAGQQIASKQRHDMCRHIRGFGRQDEKGKSQTEVDSVLGSKQP